MAIVEFTVSTSSDATDVESYILAMQPAGVGLPVGTSPGTAVVVPPASSEPDDASGKAASTFSEPRYFSLPLTTAFLKAMSHGKR